jgi:hypothetical protein
MPLPALPALPGLSELSGGLSGFAAFVRDRLAELRDASALAPARQAAVVIVAAAAPFATTSYARARLLRQMHASGLLSSGETEQAEALLHSDHGVALRG